MDETTCNARDKETVIDLELYGMLESLFLVEEHAVEAFGLCNCPGEAIKYESGREKDISPCKDSRLGFVFNHPDLHS